MGKLIVFEGALSAKQYLSKLLSEYPYDIEESLVFSLLSKLPYPYVALLRFITYFKDCTKLMLYTMPYKHHSVCLQTLLQKMSTLSQTSSVLQFTYHFDFQASVYLSKEMFTQPYAHLPLEKVMFIDHISLHDTPILPSITYDYVPITKSSSFIYQNISFDASHYLAVSIEIMDKHGIIFLSKQCLSLSIPLCAMYHVTSPSLHQDFMLIFGLYDTTMGMEYYFDETNQMYIGLVKGTTNLHHFKHLKNMITTLYNALCVHQNDLPLLSSMIQIQTQTKSFSLLFIGKNTADKACLLQNIMQQCTLRNTTYHLVCNDIGTLHNLDNELRFTQIELARFDTIAIKNCTDTLFLPNSIYIKEEAQAYQIQPCITFEESKQFHFISHVFYVDDKQHHTTPIVLDKIDKFSALFYRDFLEQTYAVLQQDFTTMLFLKNIPIYHICTKCKDSQKENVVSRLAKNILDLL